MATDGATSFISFVYVDIQWGGGAGIGFNSGDQYGLNHFMVPGALTSTTLDMELQSNINVPGVFLYHVNSEDTVNRKYIHLLPCYAFTRITYVCSMCPCSYKYGDLYQ